MSQRQSAQIRAASATLEGNMHIGLIGGIGPAATDYYYRKLIKAYAKSNSDLDLTIAHADTPTLLANLEAGRKEAQTTIYRRLTSRLKSAGAECVGVTSIAGHFCIEEFEKISELPVVNILTAVSDEIRIRRYETVGIIGTKTVMETRFYGGISSAKIVVPPPDELEAVHRAYAEMATLGAARKQHSDIFAAACHNMIETHGAQAIMMGGTDLALVYNSENAPFPIIDCADIHVGAIVQKAAS